LEIKHLSSSTRITLKKEGKTVRDINQFLSERVESELANMYCLNGVKQQRGKIPAKLVLILALLFSKKN
jgi:hypothetical protein